MLLKPTDTTDDGVKEISGGGIGVALGTQSDPIVYDNDYMWLIMTITSGAIEVDIGDGYFQGSRY